MLVYNSFEHYKASGPAVVTIGTFDGVHLGHRALLKRLSDLAARQGGKSVVLTFDPHPRMVLHPDDHGIKLLTTREEKEELLRHCGIDVLLRVPFSEAFSRMSPAEYVRDIIVNQIGTTILVVGFDHRFGRNREGDIRLLHELSGLYGYAVEEIPPEMVASHKISSTKIRQALSAGEVDLAGQLLGYHYGLTGTVVSGEGRGRSIGYPTANLAIDDRDKLVPGRGVYAVRVCAGAAWHHGVMNIGIRPTVGEDLKESLEVHIPGLDRDLYGQNLRITFAVKIRDEHKFGSIDALRLRIAEDIKTAHAYFQTHP